jgi:ribosomal protein S7
MRIKKENNYKKFLGSLIKKGNKVAAKRILTESFLDISKKKKIPAYKILNRVFSRLENFVEIKSIP